MTNHIIYILFSILLASPTLISCADRPGSVISEEEPYINDRASDGFMTRAGEDNDIDANEILTYRILTYNSKTYGFDNPNTGTFSGRPGDLMIPTKLIDDGTPDKNATAVEHAAALLDGVTGTRLIVCYSPGKINNPDGSVDFKPADVDKGRFLSSITETSLGQLRVIQLKPLYDIRSRLTFKVSIDPSVKSQIKNIKVSDFKINGVGDTIHPISVYPAQSQIKTLNPIREVTLKGNETSEELCSEYCTAHPEYIASGIYAPRNIAIDILNPEGNDSYILDSDYIGVSFMLSQNGGNPIKLSFLINSDVPELLPMHGYDFSFNIKSTTIDLSLSIYSYSDKKLHDWKTVDLKESQEEIGDIVPKLTIEVGSWEIDGWTVWNFEDYPEI